jgi:hypothetical protein
MSFIPKNPLSLPEIEHTPSTPSGTRGLFAKEDGWYEVDANGKVSKITNDGSEINSIKYYGKPGIIPSSIEMFAFEIISESDKTVKISKRDDGIGGDLVIPYECKINNEIYKVVEIADNAFGYMEGVTGIIIPSSVKIIGSFMATSCSNIKEIVIPDGVTIVGAYAFAGCSGLEKIEIPNSVTSIENAVFNSCYKLMTVNIPDGLTTIYSDTFANCGALTNINIGKSVSKIETYAFNYCSELINISIPKSMKTIENSAFWGCDKLEDVWYEGTEEEWKSIAIDGNNNPLVNATIHYKSVPATKGYVDEVIKNLGTIKSSVHILGGVQNWTMENITDANGSIIGSRYGQTVNVNNAVITQNSKVDLHASSEQIIEFYNDGLAFVAENDNGVVTVYCIGDVPKIDYEIQAVVTEVVIDE